MQLLILESGWDLVTELSQGSGKGPKSVVLIMLRNVWMNGNLYRFLIMRSKSSHNRGVHLGEKNDIIHL